MSCARALTPWVLSVSIHLLALGGATWILTGIQAPPPERVFRWDVALVEERRVKQDETPAGPRAGRAHGIKEHERRIVERLPRRVVRAAPKIVTRSTAARATRSERVVKSISSARQLVSRENPRRFITEALVTEVEAPKRLSERLKAAEPVTTRRANLASPQETVFTKQVPRTARKVVTRAQRALDGSQTRGAAHFAPQGRVATQEAGARTLDALSKAKGASAKAADGFTSRVTALTQPSVVVTPSASTVGRPAPALVDEPTTVVRAAVADDVRARSLRAGQHQSTAAAAVTPVVIEPTTGNVVSSRDAVSEIDDATSILEAHTAAPIEGKTLAAKTAPWTKSDFGWLAKTMQSRIADQKRYPYIARINHWEGKVVLRAVIADDGRLAEVTIKRSSGHDILDEEAMELVRRVCPIPLKHPLLRPQVVMHIPITYRLN